MGKRNKQSARPTTGGQPIGNSALATRQCHAPAKQPTLFAVSLVLFALWFVFLLVTAMFG
jgi:hypothetical protein